MTNIAKQLPENVAKFIVLNKCDKDAADVNECLTQIQDHCRWCKCVPVCAVAEHGPMKKQCEECQSEDLSIRKQQRSYTCHDCNKTYKLQDSYGVQNLLEE